VSAVHVNHHLRGDESEQDAAFCRETLGADVVDAPPAPTEAELRDLRYSLTHGLRATGHTASDQVETVLYRLAASGSTRGIKAKREDGVVRPLLAVWRDETEAYCREHGLAYRTDSSNPDTLRGLIRHELIPVLRRLHPAAEENIRRLADERPRLPRQMEDTLLDLLSWRAGSRTRDLGSGIRAVREYDRISLEHGPVRWGPWTIEADEPGLEVRGRKPGDRLAGRTKKLQDVFVDAKVPRAERDDWPVVVKNDEVVAVPGIVEDAAVRVKKSSVSSGGAGKGALAPGREDSTAGTELGAGGGGSCSPATSGGGGGRLRRPGAVAGEGSEDADVMNTELERAVGEILIDAPSLRARIAELGEEISEHYRGQDLLLIGVLKGAVFFMADLMRHLTVPCEVDFMAISSYGAQTDSSGVVRILKDLDINIEGRNVLVVEDIIDSGLTLSYLMRNLESRAPASLEICALLTKPSRREIDVNVRWIGFEIPNRFVIGYGLDFAERYRNLPYVGVLSEDLMPEGA
jgi:hypoxanthine phosphoribosyltransferase